MPHAGGGLTRLGMTMLVWLSLVGGLLLVHVGPAVAEPQFHVDTEDAYVTQCRAKICATLQVTRSRFSNSGVSTTLFFSAYDERGNPIAIPGFPSGFTSIPSEHFVMNPQGTQATLNYSGVSVTWLADGRSRASDGGQQISAAVKGAVGTIIFDVAARRRPGDFGSAFLTVRKTVSRTRGK